MKYCRGQGRTRDRLRLLTQASSYLLAAVAGIAVPGHVVDATPLYDIVAAMNEGDWAKVNTNSYSNVWTPVDQRPTSNDPGALIRAWSSFAWDSTRNEMILWGGGHHNYGGNDVYTWSASTLQWTRASLPSALQQIDPDSYLTIDGPMNSPIASHTYDNQEYLPVADRFIIFGGAAYDDGNAFARPGDDGIWRYSGPYLWDPSKADGDKVGGLTGSQVDPAAHPDVVGGEMWQNRDHGLPTDVIPKNSATDAVIENGKDVVYFTGVAGNGTIAGLYKYTVNDVANAAADTWQMVGVGTNGAIGSDSGSGALDTNRHLFVRSSGLNFIYWDLNTAGLATPHKFTPTIIGADFVGVGGYGIEWDPKRGWFVLWMGNGDVWYLKPPDTISTDGWTLEKAPDPGVPLTPQISDNSFFAGVLGKWKYDEADDVFIGLDNDLDGSVWVYKPVGWQGAEGPIASHEPGSTPMLAAGLVLMAVWRLRRRPQHAPRSAADFASRGILAA